MIKIFVFKENDLIVGFQIKGHSGYAEEGKDIVCSAVSTASQMCVIALEEVLKVKPIYEIKDGFLSLELEEVSEKTQVVLSSMELTLRNIEENYPKFVKMEVKRKC